MGILNVVTAVLQQGFAACPTPDEMDEARRWAATRFESPSPDPPFSFIYGGRPSRELLGTWELERTEEKLDEQRTQRVLSYTDPDTGLQVTCEATVYSGYPAVEWVVYFSNQGDQDTSIVADVQALDVEFTRAGPETILERRWNELAGEWEMREAVIEPGEFTVHHAQGGHPGMDAYEPLEDALGSGERLSISGYSSQTRMPFFNVEWPGGGMIAGIGWTAPWQAEFVRDDELSLAVKAGMEESHFLLHPGERVRMPRIAVLFWLEDRFRGHNYWRRLLLDYHSPRVSGELLQVPSGAATSQQNEAQNKSYIEWYTSNALPMEYYWMDVGWQRPPTDEEEAAGVYSESAVNAAVIPNGIRSISDFAHERGIKHYLLWFGGPMLYPNPERIRRHQPELLTEEYPGWDHGNPMVNQWMIDYYSGRIEEWGLDVFRQDTRNYPRPDTSEERVGIHWTRCVEGNYAFWDALHERFPELIIDICGGGGYNIDIEAIGRSVCLWRSDYQCGGINEPDRLFNPAGMQAQTYGISLWAPLSGGSCRMITPYAVRSAYSPSVQFALTEGPEPPSADDVDVELARKLMNEYRSVRHCFYGDYWPLTSYSLTEDAWMAWQLDRPDLGEGIVQAFRRSECDIQTCHHRLRGLEPDAHYEVSGLDIPETTRVRGSELMERGLAVTIPERSGAVVVKYKKAD